MDKPMEPSHGLGERSKSTKQQILGAVAKGAGNELLNQGQFGKIVKAGFDQHAENKELDAQDAAEKAKEAEKGGGSPAPAKSSSGSTYNTGEATTNGGAQRAEHKSQIKDALKYSAAQAIRGQDFSHLTASAMAAANSKLMSRGGAK